ncbi:MAG TPA: DUF929 family protein [Acidimicrobiales bacterium]|nr:DUF929 family protein [Acidimicrobiales bacterium]
MPAKSDHPPPTRTSRFAWGAVVVILVGVTALLVYTLTDAPTTLQVVHRVETAPDVLRTLASEPVATFDSVGVTAPETGLTPPTVVTGQPPMFSQEKPEVLFVGSEYCPFCAAERWPLILALSRFGTFSLLHDMESSTTSVFPGLQSFSFFGASYTSPYLTFTGIEIYSDVPATNGVFTKISSLTSGQQALVAHYQSAGGPGTYPLVDIDNVMVSTTSGFSPAAILRVARPTIVSDLKDATTAASRAIVASANYLSAGICVATHQNPASICSSKGVRAAALALGVG